MSTSKATVDRVLTQLAPLQVRARAMFGEYGLYCDEKFVVVICDDRCFLKETAVIGASDVKFSMRPPYPGAKAWPVVSERLLLDRTKLRTLVQATADALPASERSPLAKRTAKK